MERPISRPVSVAGRTTDAAVGADEPNGHSPAAAAAARELRQQRLATVGKLWLLAGLLAIHFAARWHHAQAMPLADRHNYERTYAYSLSLLAGKGFHNLAVPETPEAEPIGRFLDKQSDHVSAEQFETFLKHPGPSDFDADFGEHDLWASSRILDQYLVAGLWRLFGICWQVVFLFGVAMSTLTCLLVFLIGRRLGGYWAGICAAALFFASPLESYLETWSLRDASPLWFAAAGFWFLFCVVDRPTTQKWKLASCSLLGILAMAGIGWRPDVLLLVLYLGLAMLVLLRVRGWTWRPLLGSLAVYLAGAWACHTAIYSLTSEGALDSQNGFHMAVYADFSRANLLGIENSFQIHRCDRETLFVARQFQHAHDPHAPPLVYKGDHYSDVCRDMFVDELRYNAFWLVSQFPAVYWEALRGLMIPGAFETQNDQQLREGRLPILSQLFDVVCDPLTERLPLLFLLGLCIATGGGPARSAAAILGGFTLLQVAALLLVLPEQKHLASLLLPMNVLGGVGLWSLLRLLRRRNWQLAATIAWARPAKIWIRFAAAAVLVWGLACFVSYEVSSHERQRLIAAIQEAAQGATPAPDALHGDHVFSVSLLPGSLLDSTGYLLTISAGEQPGTLLCRHIHFPQDWCWPRVLETTHQLEPSREQYFFVSCLQGSRYGDPRPYNCSVFLSGDARITSCRRVDLKNWDRLQVSTLFYDGQDSPGSPRSIQINSVMRWADWPAIRSFSDEWRRQQQLAKNTLFVRPQALPAASHPIQHLVARDKASGTWKIAISDGRKFQAANINYWAPHEWSVLLSGDFNGDGLCDLLGRYTDGTWWLGLANGNCIEFKPCDVGLAGVKFDFVGVGDLNGDGIDDLAVRSADDGQWWIGQSNGTRFSLRRWGQGGTDVPPDNVRIADFNGDGRADIAGFNPRTGQWTVSLSDGAQLSTRVWASWNPAVAWRHILAADFTGRGRTDVAGWDPTTGQWQLGQSDGHRFDSLPAGNWPADVDWQHVQTGRFSGDRRYGIVGLDRNSQRLAIAEFDGKGFKTRYLPAHPALAESIYVGNFDGGNCDNLAGLTKSHEIWVGVLDHGAIQFQNWGTWQSAEQLSDVRVMRFWR